jgi:hypothetical protein
MYLANVCQRAGCVGIALCRAVAATIVLLIAWFLGMLVPDCVEASALLLLKALSGTPEFSTGGFNRVVAISLTFRLLWFAACVILLIADLRKDGGRKYFSWAEMSGFRGESRSFLPALSIIRTRLDAGLSLGALCGILLGLLMMRAAIGI